MMYACSDNEDCQTCTLTGCGVVGCSPIETRDVCDEGEAEELVMSSNSAGMWVCE